MFLGVSSSFFSMKFIQSYITFGNFRKCKYVINSYQTVLLENVKLKLGNKDLAINTLLWLIIVLINKHAIGFIIFYLFSEGYSHFYAVAYSRIRNNNRWTKLSKDNLKQKPRTWISKTKTSKTWAPKTRTPNTRSSFLTLRLRDM